MMDAVKRELRWIALEVRIAREELAFWIRPGSSYHEVRDSYQELKLELVKQESEALRDRDWDRYDGVKEALRHLQELGDELDGGFKPLHSGVDDDRLGLLATSMMSTILGVQKIAGENESCSDE